MRLFFLCLLFLSCAHNRPVHKHSIVDEVNQGNISSQTVLDLARTSYLRGCVDSKNRWHPEKNKPAFNTCLKMAREHEKDIEAIINSQVKTQKLKKKILREK